VRHRKAARQLGRSSAHRRAMLDNLLIALVEHGRIRTTTRKAAELRRVAERAVTRGVRLGDVLLKDWSKLEAEDNARLVHAIRLVRRSVRDRTTVLRLFEEWAPRYLGRPGGYTRVFKLGNRRGDNAPMALVEFVPAEMPQREGQPEKAGKRRRRGILRRSVAEKDA